MNGSYQPIPAFSKSSGESACGITNRDIGFTFDYIEKYTIGGLNVYNFTMTVSSSIPAWTVLFNTSGSTSRVCGILSKSQSYETSELYRESGIRVSTALTAGCWRGFMIMF